MGFLEKAKGFLKQITSDAPMKGQMTMGMLQSITLGIVITAIIGVVGLQVLTSVQSTQTVNGTAYNATTDAIEGIGQIFTNFGLVGLIAGLAVVLGVLFVALRGGDSR